ncbi:hypothetical protein [Phenylobacterium sp.]|jgi:hypothetical protein|uniref:hypothetical protein n=1 Tax=Phenylobacterium sp. TaxID=1871053 RepID=UPI002F91C48A
MASRRYPRGAVAVGVSAALHLVVLAVLALHAPKAPVRPPEAAGPPIPIIPVLLAPMAVPPGPAGEGGGPIRLHRRQVRPRDLPAHVRPLIAPTAAQPEAVEVRPAPSPVAASSPPPAGGLGPLELSRVLRSGVLGCANPGRLSREERARCEEQLASGARDAPFTGPGVSPDKLEGFAAVAARKAADARYRGAPPTPPVAAGRGGPGASASDMARQLGNDRPSASRPF